MVQCFKEFYFTFCFIYFQCPNHQPTVFITTLKSKFNSPFLTSLKSFVRRKLIPVFDPIPLCCSSLTTTVGGTKDTNIVDSESPYCGTNQMAPLPGIPLYKISRSFHLGFALLSSLSSFFHFLGCQTTPLEDNNSRDAWLSLIALKRKVAILVLGLLQVVLMY